MRYHGNRSGMASDGPVTIRCHALNFRTEAHSSQVEPSPVET